MPNFRGIADRRDPAFLVRICEKVFPLERFVLQKIRQAIQHPKSYFFRGPIET